MRERARVVPLTQLRTQSPFSIRPSSRGGTLVRESIYRARLSGAAPLTKRKEEEKEREFRGPKGNTARARGNVNLGQIESSRGQRLTFNLCCHSFPRPRVVYSEWSSLGRPSVHPLRVLHERRESRGKEISPVTRLFSLWEKGKTSNNRRGRRATPVQRKHLARDLSSERSRFI